jgi:hypothetical protein
VRTRLFIEGSNARQAAEALGKLPGLTVDITGGHTEEHRKDPLLVLSVVHGREHRRISVHGSRPDHPLAA